MSRRRTFIVFFALTFFATSHAAAWTRFHSGWRTMPVTYYFQDPSNDLGAEVSEKVIHRAVVDWMNVPCTSLRAAFEGHTTRVPGANDGYNVFGWIHENWTAGSGVIGQTNFRSSSAGSESDIKFNGVHFSWTTGNGTSRNVNAYSIVAHEIGHFFGLGHSTSRDDVMYASYSGGVLAIGSDDTEGICTLYPGAKPGCDATRCPPGYGCNDGYCTEDGSPPPPPPPPSPISIPCAPCEKSSDCGGNADRCLHYAMDGGKTFCGRACGTDAECGDDQRCLAIPDAGTQCVRVVNGIETCEGATTMPPPSTPGPSPMPDGMVGTPCEINEDCGGGVCLEQSGASMCTRGCDASASCPAGYSCQELSGDAFCVAPAHGLDAPATSVRGGCSIGSAETAADQASLLGWLFLAGLLVWRRRPRS